MIKQKELFNEQGFAYFYCNTDSYEKKEELKEAGFFWSNLYKAWVSHQKDNSFAAWCKEINGNSCTELQIMTELKKAKDSYLPKSNSEWLYNVGDKISNVEMTLVSIREIESLYGLTYLHTFKKGDNTLTWFTQSGRKGAAGVTYKVSATVKEHKEFRGDKQTVLTRCKLKEGTL